MAFFIVIRHGNYIYDNRYANSVEMILLYISRKYNLINTRQLSSRRRGAAKLVLLPPRAEHHEVWFREHVSIVLVNLVNALQKQALIDISRVNFKDYLTGFIIKKRITYHL